MMLFILFIYPGYCYSASSSPHSTGTVSEFHAEAPQVIASEELAQYLYLAARAGLDPKTLRTIGVESTNEPPRSTLLFYVHRHLAVAAIHSLLLNGFLPSFYSSWLANFA